jgi:hypothetical protein
MRRLLTTLASAIVIAVLTLGVLEASNLLRLVKWSEWAVGIGLFAVGGSVAGDIWWREFKVLAASRRRRSRNLRTSGTKATVLYARLSRRVGAVRRFSPSNQVFGNFLLTALLLLFIGLLVFSAEDFVRFLSDPELRRLIKFNR